MNSWVWILLLLGFVIAYFWWILAVAGPVALVWWAYRLWQKRHAERDAAAAERVAIADRAVQQHGQVLDGDDRGIYGEYPPAV
jgi:hypothetical protein